jgi:DNA-binding FadR family transcriptional regulator
MTRQTDLVPYPKQHRTLLDALKTGDPHIARETTHAHVMESAKLALAKLPDEGTINVPRGPGR